MNIEKVSRIFVVITLLVTLVVGISVYKDYGISWDEPIQRDTGQKIYSFAHNNDDKLLEHVDRYYGPFFEYVLIALENAFSLVEYKEVYEMRHLATFLFNFVGLSYFYLLCKRLVRSDFVALTGLWMLILSPRIFANSFYNTKDLVFMTTMIISFYYLVLFTQNLANLKSRHYIFLAIASSIAITTRIMGVIVPVFAVYALAVSEIKQKNHKSAATKPFQLLSLTALITYFMWPILWDSPIKGFVAAFSEMSSYNQKTSTLYFGKGVSSLEVPWHYTLGWILVTTPTLYTVLFSGGIIKTLLAIVKGRTQFLLNYERLFVLGWFFVPLIATGVFKSTLYNGWRQMYFVYPAFLMIGISFFAEIMKRKLLTFLLVILLVLQFVVTGNWMVRWHPFQYVFFNEPTKRLLDIENNFELDYWGVSSKQVLECIAQREGTKNIKIASSHLAVKNTIPYLTGHNFEYTRKQHEADYMISHEIKKRQNKYTAYVPKCIISVDNFIIAKAYDRR